MIYNQSFCFPDFLRGLKQPCAQVVGRKANARSQRRDIQLRIIGDFSLEVEESSFCKQLRSNNDFFGTPLPPRIFVQQISHFLSQNFIKSLSFFCVLKKEENRAGKASATVKHLFRISSGCLLSYLKIMDYKFIQAEQFFCKYLESFFRVKIHQ